MAALAPHAWLQGVAGGGSFGGGSSSYSSCSTPREMACDLILKPCSNLPLGMHIAEARLQDSFHSWASASRRCAGAFSLWVTAGSSDLGSSSRLGLFAGHAIMGDKGGSDKVLAEQEDLILGDTGNGSGNTGDSNHGNGGDSGGDGGQSGGHGEDEDDSFGPLLDADEVRRLARGVPLPTEMARVAETIGIRKLILLRYLDLQGSALLGPAVRGSALLRNRMLADPSFFFKVLTEIGIDSACATFAEVQKRGKDFWNEFELYLSDLLVGVVLDVALVSLLAPFVQFGARPSGKGVTGALSRAIQALPSSVFEAQRPGRRFTIPQRGIAFVYKAGQYGVMGFGCGLVGQGIASSLMTLKRKWRKADEEEVAVPDIVKSAAVWGGFMALSSNTRYQIINGLEQVVESSAVAQRMPLIAMAFTVGIRFANNIYGGMQFVDWARWAGVQ